MLAVAAELHNLGTKTAALSLNHRLSRQHTQSKALGFPSAVMPCRSPASADVHYLVCGSGNIANTRRAFPLSWSSRAAARNGTRGQGYVHPLLSSPTPQILITGPLPAPVPASLVSIGPQTDSRLRGFGRVEGGVKGHSLSSAWPVRVCMLRVWACLSQLSFFFFFKERKFFLFFPWIFAYEPVDTQHFLACGCVCVLLWRLRVWASKRQRSRFERFTWLRLVPEKKRKTPPSSQICCG